jgi:CubicO group peptidase (beta-lactamase class C family)
MMFAPAAGGPALIVSLLAAVLAPWPLQAQHAGPYAPVAAEVQRGIARGLYPGGVIVVGRHDAILYARGLGHFTWSRRSPVPDPATSRWDLASLTKVVATATVAARLVDAGLLDLDRPVDDYLPGFTGDGRELVTVRMLLDHTSGLPSFVPFYRRAATPAAAWDSLLATPLLTIPGFLTRYSDLNAMLLGRVLERLTGEPLDRLAARLVFEPLRMSRTGFAPSLSARHLVVPSQMEDGRPVVGMPSDPNAAFLGGVAGHAGLFATGLDLARFAQVWLDDGRVEGATFLSAGTVRTFLTPSGAGGVRRLGWDGPDATVHPSAFGRLADSLVVGHTGWTGTFLWIDPARDLFVVFLTNRSLQPRRRQSMVEMREVRSRVSDAVIRASGGCGPAAPALVAC